MKKWLIWPREHRKDWPILVSIVVGFLNIEVATPFILKGFFELSGTRLGVSAGIWASVELCWWSYFSGWLYRNKIRKLGSVTEIINIGKAAKKFDWRGFSLPKTGDPYLVIKIKDFIRKHSIDNFDPDKYEDDHFFISLISLLKGFGYVLTCGLIFVMGFLPLWWVFALMVCRLLRWRLAYLALFSSNFLKNYLMASVYEKIGFLWWIVLFIMSVIAMSYILKTIANKLKLITKNHP
ncbi:MAG: hypothetical protein Q8Q89_05220 [bacterium]|nr:hypothetical protein [bacterium]